MDNQASYQRYVDLCYRYLTFRNRSKKEMYEYLQKKNASDEIIDQIIDKLQDQGYINDEKFARAWVLARARSKPKGRTLLVMELRQKGISQDIIEQVLAEESEELPDELAQAISIIARHMEKLDGFPRQAVYQKVGAFLMRRGYNWGIAKKAIDSYLEK